MVQKLNVSTDSEGDTFTEVTSNGIAPTYNQDDGSYWVSIWATCNANGGPTTISAWASAQGRR